MKIKAKIKEHYKKQKFCRITRAVAEDWEEISRGYILDYSKKFLVFQEADDFRVLGFSITPIHQIKDIRYNNHDRYYDKIMGWENQKVKIRLKTKVDLTDWKSIFKTFQQKEKSIIVECENPKIDSFTIGVVKRIGNKSVSILYFDAAGFLDKKASKIKFKNITKITFDDRYVDIFSKYTREQKNKL